MKKYICDVCGWIYDPIMGEPSQEILPGVPFEKLPDTFFCPECGVGKDQFSLVAE
ncbi:MAG: rubredoxin [Chlamydiota bacterium]